MMFRKVNMDANKKLKVICIVCRSKSCVGRCRFAMMDRWTPQPPKLA
jgi:hypothetical protein